MLVAVCFATGLVATHPAAAQDGLGELESDMIRVFERVAPSVVIITTTEGTGSGFFVSSEGLVLTNAHVVGKSKTVRVVTHDGKKTKGTVVERIDVNDPVAEQSGELLDLALVDTGLGDTPALPLAGMQDVRVGTWVGTVGHGHGHVWSYTTGHVSNVYPGEKSRPIFQTQIPIVSGNSGGPIFDR